MHAFAGSFVKILSCPRYRCVAQLFGAVTAASLIRSGRYGRGRKFENANPLFHRMSTKQIDHRENEERTTSWWITPGIGSKICRFCDSRSVGVRSGPSRRWAGGSPRGHVQQQISSSSQQQSA